MERHFKNRALVLIIASVISVAGALGEENYKNSLMSLKFTKTNNDSVNMTLFTKQNYAQNVTLTKQDSNTYVLMLPETNSLMAEQPALISPVNSVNIRTMPYTKTGKGYTKITVKADSGARLTTSKAVFIPPAKSPTDASKNNTTEYPKKINVNNSINQNKNTTNDKEAESKKPSTQNQNKSPNTYDNSVDVKKGMKEFSPSPNIEKKAQKSSEDIIESENQQDNSNSYRYEIILGILGAILVMTSTAFFFIRGKNKMAEILGEQFEIDISEKAEESTSSKEKNKKNKLKEKIQVLDKKYNTLAGIKQQISKRQNGEDNNSSNTDYTPFDEDKVVDLDMLFNNRRQSIVETLALGDKLTYTNQYENNNDTDEINDNLEDFLSSMASNTDEEISSDNIEDIDFFQENEVNHILNNNSIFFTLSDIEKINELISVEISNDALNYLIINPVENTEEAENRRKNKIMQDLIIEYSIRHNICFNDDDIRIIDELMHVELDSDFINDLRTDAEKTRRMHWDIINAETKRHDIKTVLTLDVTGADLPNLQEELNAIGNNPIESNAKPEVIYCDSKYDVNVISVADNLPNLQNELQKEAIKEEEEEVAPDGLLIDLDTGFILSDAITDSNMNINEQDSVTASPNDNSVDFVQTDNARFGNAPEQETIPDTTEKFVIKESKMDNNTEQTVNAEIIGDTDPGEQEDIDEKTVGNVCESAEESVETSLSEENQYNEKNQQKEYEQMSEAELELNNEDAPEQSEEPITNTEQESKLEYDYRLKRNDEEKLLERIKKKDKIRKQKAVKIDENTDESVTALNKDTKILNLNGINYEILSSSAFNSHTGCYLAVKENMGRSVLGYIDDSVFEIKYYEDTNSEKLQTRPHEQLENGATRYLVKTGLHKFILNVAEDNLEYVMDLC